MFSLNNILSGMSDMQKSIESTASAKKGKGVRLCFRCAFVRLCVCFDVDVWRGLRTFLCALCPSVDFPRTRSMMNRSFCVLGLFNCVLPLTRSFSGCFLCQISKPSFPVCSSITPVTPSIHPSLCTYTEQQAKRLAQHKKERYKKFIAEYRAYAKAKFKHFIHHTKHLTPPTDDASTAAGATSSTGASMPPYLVFKLKTAAPESDDKKYIIHEQAEEFGLVPRKYDEDHPAPAPPTPALTSSSSSSSAASSVSSSSSPSSASGQAEAKTKGDGGDSGPGKTSRAEASAKHKGKGKEAEQEGEAVVEIPEGEVHIYVYKKGFEPALKEQVSYLERLTYATGKVRSKTSAQARNTKRMYAEMAASAHTIDENAALNAVVQLQTSKRDLRSIEEIQHDLKLRKKRRVGEGTDEKEGEGEKKKGADDK